MHLSQITKAGVTRAKDLLKHTRGRDISSSGEASAAYPATSKVASHRWNCVGVGGASSCPGRSGYG
jgi:hypothetical protein